MYRFVDSSSDMSFLFVENKNLLRAIARYVTRSITDELQIAYAEYLKIIRYIPSVDRRQFIFKLNLFIS